MSFIFCLKDRLELNDCVRLLDTVQRAFSTGPDQLASAGGQGAETAMLVSSLRDMIRKQTEETEALRAQLAQAANVPAPVDRSQEVDDLKKEVASLKEKAEKEDAKRKELEKEQEDLYVLLDEVNSKRKADKVKMREAGIVDVSDDEDDDDEEEDDEESD